MNSIKFEAHIFTPDGSVASMANEAMRAHVMEAIKAARKFSRPLAIKRQTRVRKYGTDFEGAVDAVARFAQSSDQFKLAIVVTDLECLQEKKAGEKLGLLLTNWRRGVLVVVPVSHQIEGRNLETRLPNLEFASLASLASPEKQSTTKARLFLEGINDAWPEWIRPKLAAMAADVDIRTYFMLDTLFLQSGFLPLDSYAFQESV